jgi:hypothetical protein
MTSRLDDAAAALPAPDDIFGLPVDHDWREVNRYQPTGDDGHEVVVSVARMPAKFWRIECPDLELDLVTGSGMHGLADSIAEAIADGRLGVGDAP